MDKAGLQAKREKKELERFEVSLRVDLSHFSLPREEKGVCETLSLTVKAFLRSTLIGYHKKNTREKLRVTVSPFFKDFNRLNSRRVEFSWR